MAINTDKRTVRLLCATDCETAKTVGVTVADTIDFMPGRSCLFSPDAAKAAGALAMSAGDEGILKRDLGELGFGDVILKGYSNDGAAVGLCLGSRIREGALETAVVLRGTEGDEWRSNFDLGYSAEHRGFSRAADHAEQTLADYIFTRAIGLEPRFFVCGYSRGGATANILAKRLCDRYGTDSVRAYTFAAPRTTISRRTSGYSCVFNLIRDEDFFTRVPPEGWGYARYGRDISLSAAGDVSELFRDITGEEYIGFTRQASVDNFIRAVTGLAPNVHAYYKRKRRIDGQRLSLYEFMNVAADLLGSGRCADAADIFMSAMVSEYADLMSFLSSGADLVEMIGSASCVPRCSVADSHSPAAYMAALELYARSLSAKSAQGCVRA